MKHTSTSSNIMNTLNATLTTDIEPQAKAPILAMMKIIHVNAMAMACPASMLAKIRTISANGFVNILNTSIRGISGSGTFSHHGMSGQKMSFQ